MPWFGMDIGGTLCKLVFFEPTDINDINNGIKRNKSDHKTLLNIRYGFTFCIPTFQLPIRFVEDIKCWKCIFFYWKFESNSKRNRYISPGWSIAKGVNLFQNFILKYSCKDFLPVSFENWKLKALKNHEISTVKNNLPLPKCNIITLKVLLKNIEIIAIFI